MAIISGLSIDLEGDLSDIPLGSNGDIARLDDGGYAVIAEIEGTGTSVLRIFDAEGIPVRSIGFEGRSPSITGLSDGGIGVAAIDANGNMVTSVVSADFETVSAPSVLDGQPAFLKASLSAGPQGTFFMVTQDDFGSDNDVNFHTVDASGQVVSTRAIEDSSTVDSRDPDVARLANGHVVVTRTEHDLTTGDTVVVFSVYDESGNETVARTEIPNIAGAGEDRHARVAATADGFAIVYETRVAPFTALDIRMRTFDFAGVQTSNELITSRDFFITGNDDGVDDTAPSIAIGPDGGVAITWTRNDDGNTDQVLTVLGQSGDQIVKFFTSDNPQDQPLVTFFGTGQIAAYHVDGTENALVGEHFSGFRDSFGNRNKEVFSGDDFVDLINGLGGNDKLSGGGNNDEILGGSGDDTLFGNTGDDALSGEGDNDRLDGGRGSDSLSGSSGGDQLKGGSQGDVLAGDSGEDTLLGGSGADTLEGGSDRDTLTGGRGADIFVYRFVILDSRDVITDFAIGTDKIGLDFQAFFAVGSVVQESHLRQGTAAQDADDFLIYSAATGRLLFDADANGAGDAVLLAILIPGTALAFTDFTIV